MSATQMSGGDVAAERASVAMLAVLEDWHATLLDGRASHDVIYRGQVLAEGDTRSRGGRRFVCEHEHPDRDTAIACGEQWLAANPAA